MRSRVAGCRDGGGGGGAAAAATRDFHHRRQELRRGAAGESSLLEPHRARGDARPGLRGSSGSRRRRGPRRRVAGPQGCVRRETEAPAIRRTDQGRHPAGHHPVRVPAPAARPQQAGRGWAGRPRRGEAEGAAPAPGQLQRGPLPDLVLPHPRRPERLPRAAQEAAGVRQPPEPPQGSAGAVRVASGAAVQTGRHRNAPHRVVCVGGDGTVAEVVNGLLLRAQRDVGTDPDGAFTPAPTHLPIGIIPAGSTDVVAFSMHGTSHAATASLHIILGHLLPVDVCSLAVRGRLLRFGFSAMLGFGGRSLAIAERHRWMPPNQRRDFAVLKALASLRPVDCEIGFLPASEGASGQTAEGARALKRWDSSAKIPGGAQVGATGEDASGPLWLHTSGDFLNVTVAAVPCRCAVAPRGLAPDTLLDDGSMSLIAVRSTTRAHFVKYLKRFGSSKAQPNPPFVDSMAVQAVRVTPRGHPSGEDGSSRWGDGEGETAGAATDGRCFWNVDGVLLEETGEVHIRVHTRLVTLYGCSLGHDDEDAAMKCNCL
ncbi:ceramide kinase-like protein isoform X2 [Lampetra planeri]